MKFTLKLKGPLQKYAENCAQVDLDFDDQLLTIRDLLLKYQIPASSVSFVQLNAGKVDLDHPIKGGDIITINPRVAGG
jgi:molybdopterin converting factor small subunit